MGRLTIIDVAETIVQTELQKEKLPREFGMNLDTVAKARQWLTNPNNWHDSNMFILKWDGLIPTVSRHHGMRLVNEPWDNGLPEVVVRQQWSIRRGAKEEKEDTYQEE